mmetsp:Transcript_21050/g.31653  ORF Transcript_21050/g.31653 Transcript_21050/m.31653 type:complete len:109 (-) Transcript_21050:64-390(-)
MQHIHLTQNSRPIVGNEHLAGGQLHQFVHAAGAEGGADGGCDGFGGDDVGLADVFAFGAFLKGFAAEEGGHFEIMELVKLENEWLTTAIVDDDDDIASGDDGDTDWRG